MAPLLLSELLGAIEASLARAQVASHVQARELATQYARDDVLRLFKVPNFEMEAVEIDVPVYPQGVQGAAATPGPELPRTYQLVLESAGANPVDVIKAIRTLTGLGLAEAKKLVEQCPKVVLSSSDADLVGKAAAALEASGARTRIVAVVGREAAPIAPRRTRATRASADRPATPAERDLIVALEPVPDHTPMVLRLRIRPATLSIVKSDAAGEHYLLEPTPRE